MRVVFFVEGATDPIEGFEARGVRFVPIAAGPGEFDTTISCFHLAPGSHLSQIPFLQDTMLLVLHGELTPASHSEVQSPLAKIALLYQHRGEWGGRFCMVG
jgi:hypothetical protein